jgi:hypothetical protein
MWQKIALVYLISIGFMAWGFMVGKYEVFPYRVIQEVKYFIDGHRLGKDTSVFDKLVNDAGLAPRRYMRKYPNAAVEGALPLDINDLKSRRDKPLVYVSPEHHTGYRVVFGALDFNGVFWGGVLLSPEGKSLHTWKLSTEHLSTNTANDELRNLYGVHLFPDGSVIFTQQERGGGIVKVDACGSIRWNLEGDYHHTISPTDGGDFWTFGGKQEDYDHKFVRVSQQTGEIKSVIDMADVRKSNPYLHIFNLQVDRSASDISHGNDIEPLPLSVADKFPQFNAGDLLVSYRTQNLVFVLDPDTLKIKWWRIGPWGRQHDADWEPDGKITVFGNNEGTDRNFSDIVAIDPATFDAEVLVDGEKYSFYSAFNGDHQRTEFDTRVVTSTTQGWAFEIDSYGKVVFSFVNAYDSKSNTSLNVSEVERLPDDYFKTEFWKQCSS